MPQLAFSPGPWELLLIFAVVFLVFGARKLPQLARSMGSSITQFKKGLREDPDSLPEGRPDSREGNGEGKSS